VKIGIYPIKSVVKGEMNFETKWKKPIPKGMEENHRAKWRKIEGSG
jgi:hypothetical protein